MKIVESPNTVVVDMTDAIQFLEEAAAKLEPQENAPHFVAVKDHAVVIDDTVKSLQETLKASGYAPGSVRLYAAIDLVADLVNEGKVRSDLHVRHLEVQLERAKEAISVFRAYAVGLTKEINELLLEEAPDAATKMQITSCMRELRDAEHDMESLLAFMRAELQR